MEQGRQLDKGKRLQVVMREGLEEGLEEGKKCSVEWRIEDGGRR